MISLGFCSHHTSLYTNACLFSILAKKNLSGCLVRHDLGGSWPPRILCGSAHFAVALDDVSLSEFDKSALSIYPTPSDGNLTIETQQLIGQKAIISVIDVSGKIVWNQTIQSNAAKEHLQINDLTAGSYLMTVESEGRILRRKIILQ